MTAWSLSARAPACWRSLVPKPSGVCTKMVRPMTWAVTRLGPVGVLLLMIPESACLPVPSEVTLMAAGGYVGFTFH